MTDLSPHEQVCSRCGHALSPGDLVCPSCGELVHIERLRELSQQAQPLERTNPNAACAIWMQCLQLLPDDSQQADWVRQRIAMLQSGQRPAPPPRPQQARAPTVLDNPLIRTGGSMLVSMLVYSYFLDWQFAIGFVILIWVHEMGHVLAMRHYGIRGTAPLFIPFIGAVITVRSLPDAWKEAVVGIGGPVAGTVASLASFATYQQFHQPLFLNLAYWGFAMNLFNLLPIPPLDGGRVTAAVSPWIWPLGFLGLLWMAFSEFQSAGYSLTGISPALLLILFLAPRRVLNLLRNREASSPYYQIGKAKSRSMGVMFVALAAVLFVAMQYSGRLGAQ